ncbi:Chaperone SurA [Paraliobacillus sp. PM-2]|uniref:SurA N-terminal domain-containing protein n=1 Tax=Paraliobacillus sp. PM-2 TaxID=1462524 RepID=UPI00061BF048|nr:SurA N-terminal domain-containing protein [Paraliobacillus sp. PM-2]CQR46382.1 Chaperone SurA [Paraliobacillus sp. PM-2]
MLKKIGSFLLVSMLFTILVACSDSGEERDESTNRTSDSTTEEVTVSEDEIVGEDMVVAVVNGEKLTGEKYNTVYTQTKTLLSEQGQDVDDQAFIKERALNALVSQEVLSQDAEENGINITDKEIDDYIAEAKAQFDSEELFEQELEKLNYTIESFREQVAMQLEQKAYVKESFGDIEVSDEEIESYYNELKKQSDELPKLEEVRDSIEAQLANKQLQDKLNQRIKKLKDDAEIEMNIS